MTWWLIRELKINQKIQIDHFENFDVSNFVIFLDCKMIIKNKFFKTYVSWIKNDLNLFQKLRNHHFDIEHARLRKLFNAKIFFNRKRSINFIINKIKRLTNTKTIIKKAKKCNEIAKIKLITSKSKQTSMKNFLIEYDHIVNISNVQYLRQR